MSASPNDRFWGGPEAYGLLTKPRKKTERAVLLFGVVFGAGVISLDAAAGAYPNATALPLDHFLNAVVSETETLSLRADEECCTDPGAVAGCWWQDAEQDRVVCNDDSDCAGANACNKEITVDGASPPNNWGLCECESSDDCGLGYCVNGLCGPSFCNGFLVCACWGGCTDGDAWGQDTPKDACENTAEGFPGACCEGDYPQMVDGTGTGFCSVECVEPGAKECEFDSDCIDHLDATLSLDCTTSTCDDGTCVVANVNEGSACSDNAQVPDPFPSWYIDCRQYACTADGTCELGLLAAGTECDNGDICTLRAECDTDGSCEAVSPDTASEVCCDPSVSDTYDDDNACTADSCSGSDAAPPFRDQHSDLADGTSCANGVDRIDDDCGIYVCSSGACEETTALFIGGDCNTTAWDTCLRYQCSAADGEEGTCVAVARNEGGECEWTTVPDTCGRKICQAGICDFELSVGDTDCVPSSGTVDPCCDYACSASNQCEAVTCASTDETLDTCSGGDLGTLGTTIGSKVSVEGSNRCTGDDYDVLTDGLFSACDTPDDAETVYHFIEETHLSEYQLRHTDVALADDGTWDPVLYTATSCEAAGASPVTQSDQYTCEVGASPSITSGPWPLVDTPAATEETGYTTANTRTTSVFVDARNTASPSGGQYTLSAIVAAHDNSACVNTADEVQAPRFVGGSNWKERFRGNTTGYDNFFYSKGASLSDYCWDGGSVSSSDPKFAFFRVDLPDGSAADEMSSGLLDWDRTYKLYTDPLGTGGLDDVLSFWGNNTPDGDCSSDLSSRQSCQNPDFSAPREIVFEAGEDSLRGGFAAVSNRAGGASGNYEINLLRVPRPFLGMAQQFVGPGDGAGCSCDPPSGWSQAFDLGGYRLDFIPTNDDVAGYAVRKTAVADSGSFLVPIGGTQVCEGLDCASPSDTTPFDMEFQFPYSGELWPKFCVDAAGRIILAKTTTDCVNKWDEKPNTDEFLTGVTDGEDTDPDAEPPVTPAIAPLWGSIVPCNQFTEPSCSWLGFWRTDGDLKCDTSWLCWLGCGVWQWRETSCTNPGQIRKQLTEFEGTAAMVITWQGFDGYFNPRDGGADHAIDFQVILRVDGRITFFYRMPDGGSSDWTTFLDMNGWMVGLSGGRSVGCSASSECNSAFGGSGLSCDTADYSVDGNLVWDAREKCMNIVDLQSSETVPVSGSWQGE